MKTIIVENVSKPIFSWCEEIEAEALEDMKLIAGLPFVKHAALMPDAHKGMKMPIGGVVACENVIVPSFVGLDIGCGVIAVKSNVHRDQLTEEIKVRLYHSVCRGVPMGFSHNTDRRVNELKSIHREEVEFIIGDTENDNVVNHLEKAIWEQLATCGGGNHFLELDYDENGFIWIVIHSGSRNIGKKICDYFDKCAIEQNKIWFSLGKDVTEKGFVPFLPVSSFLGQEYLRWMNLALQFALLNRTLMLKEVMKDLSYDIPSVCFETPINIHHNYASLENHFGKNYWVHRKGATLARNDTIGIVPGSMGTATYIVQGLGNELSLNSCSHGAGRKMGRKAFNVEHSSPEALAKIEASMDGIIHAKFGTASRGRDKGMKDVSEAPAAYKDIDQVMLWQQDLVRPIAKLRPIINWKDAGEE
jgi:tRNA-splicing ligase RtcB